VKRWLVMAAFPLPSTSLVTVVPRDTFTTSKSSRKRHLQRRVDVAGAGGPGSAASQALSLRGTGRRHPDDGAGSGRILEQRRGYPARRREAGGTTAVAGRAGSAATGLGSTVPNVPKAVAHGDRCEVVAVAGQLGRIRGGQGEGSVGDDEVRGGGLSV